MNFIPPKKREYQETQEQVLWREIVNRQPFGGYKNDYPAVPKPPAMGGYGTQRIEKIVDKDSK